MKLNSLVLFYQTLITEIREIYGIKEKKANHIVTVISTVKS